MFQREPVLVLLAGLAGVVNVTLGALAAIDVVTWDASQIAAVVAAVTIICGMLAAMLRAAVVSPATDAERTQAALAGVVPGD